MLATRTGPRGASDMRKRDRHGPDRDSVGEWDSDWAEEGSKSRATSQRWGAAPPQMIGCGSAVGKILVGHDFAQG